MAVNVKNILLCSIHSLSKAEWEKFSSSFVPAIRTTSRNSLWYFCQIDIRSFLLMENYLQMSSDEHGIYCWSYVCNITEKEFSSRDRSTRSATFGVPKFFMSDVLNYGMNETLWLLCKGLCVPHHSTLPFLLWSDAELNGICEALFEMLCAITSDSQMVQTGACSGFTFIIKTPLKYALLLNWVNETAIRASAVKTSSGPIIAFSCTATSSPISIATAVEDVEDMLKTLASYGAALSHRRRVSPV